jgi:hypothetical protein
MASIQTLRILLLIAASLVLLFIFSIWILKSEENRTGLNNISQEKILNESLYFLNTLEPEQKKETVVSFDSDERFNFHYIPMKRVGLSIKEMNTIQRAAVHNLLQTALSSQGYLKVVGIMHLEDILAIVEGDDIDIDRDPELYYITFFGEPSNATPWGWRFEGHHISLNFTSAGNELFANTPAFLGTNPAEVKSGPYTGLRVLANEEDLGRVLIGSFNENQLMKAIIPGEIPRDIVTRRDRRVMLEQKSGVPYSEMTSQQRDMLMQIVNEYAYNLKPELAEVHLKRMYEAGVDSLHFAWAGGLEKGQPHYYRIHGPTLLFEYDNVQNNANHVHTVWRDIENDFGDDMLLRHYQTAPESHGHQY